ncbi:MAG: PHP domain-containing protein [Gammaproteobacteria bacterium]|nr:PHP domain-containing protein [Gammaproteobacteria bacterium]
MPATLTHELNHDLHSHSTASDGTLSPAELVRRAHAQGVDVLALTDHDSTAGVAEASEAAATLGLRLVPGVEVSVTWNGVTIHILGLNVDPEHLGLQQGLAQLRVRRDERGKEIARRLAKAGIEGALEGAQAYASGAIISRTHFARFLVEQGHAKDMRKVFKKFLVNNRPGYVPGDWASLDEALGWIHAAGGLAVIAHPARYRLSATRLRQFIGEFKEYGGQGIEVVSGSHSAGDVQGMAQYARRFELLASCGSDYHGPEQPWVELGQLTPLPENCTPVWQQWETAA